MSIPKDFPVQLHDVKIHQDEMHGDPARPSSVAVPAMQLHRAANQVLLQVFVD